ncbi:MAG: DUF1465 family protein [Sphingomonadales bacterium]|nr:DUF1465 family protein [Sphingomonadales bacterium]MBU3992254.1 DUF1465 family protein [Alphaproteobacteria bacterium]
MGQPTNLNARIIESLYAEGLMLSDEVRAAFDLTQRPPADQHPDPEDATRIALSCEALRTTTRMMHAVAWLLNQRAYFQGEISELQLRRHGRIPGNLSPAEPERLALLDPETRDLIRATERFHARLVRLDAGWREAGAAASTIEQLRERLARAVR